ncbi:MAG TPA: hypothetical protein VH593_31815 [Ktedonobacteraceae bacterium]|jgi:hypothetical protein
MMQCKHCHFENTEKNLYCKRCGSPLPVLVPYYPTIEDYISSPLSQEESYYPFIYQRHPKKSVFFFFRTTFYFAVALPITVFGLIGFFSTIGTNATVTYAALAVTFSVVAVSTTAYRRTRTRVPYLSWGSFLIWVTGTTSGAFLAFCGEIAALPNATTKPLGVALTCGIITIYGTLLECVSLW